MPITSRKRLYVEVERSSEDRVGEAMGLAAKRYKAGLDDRGTRREPRTGFAFSLKAKPTGENIPRVDEQSARGVASSSATGVDSGLNLGAPSAFPDASSHASLTQSRVDTVVEENHGLSVKVKKEEEEEVKADVLVKQEPVEEEIKFEESQTQVPLSAKTKGKQKAVDEDGSPSTLQNIPLDDIKYNHTEASLSSNVKIEQKEADEGVPSVPQQKISSRIPLEVPSENKPGPSVAFTSSIKVKTESHADIHRTPSEVVSSSSSDFSQEHERPIRASDELVNTLTKYRSFLGTVKKSLTCTVCLDLFYKPFTLPGCGHMCCYTCLVRWFGHDSKRTCPQCRAPIARRPTESWAVRELLAGLVQNGLVAAETRDMPPLPLFVTEAQRERDPWVGMFPDLDEPGEVHQEEVGVYDEPEGMWRCWDCFQELRYGVCICCEKVHPANRFYGLREDEVRNGSGNRRRRQEIVMNEGENRLTHRDMMRRVRRYHQDYEIDDGVEFEIRVESPEPENFGEEPDERGDDRIASLDSYLDFVARDRGHAARGFNGVQQNNPYSGQELGGENAPPVAPVALERRPLVPRAIPAPRSHNVDVDDERGRPLRAQALPSLPVQDENARPARILAPQPRPLVPLIIPDENWGSGSDTDTGSESEEQEPDTAGGGPSYTLGTPADFDTGACGADENAVDDEKVSDHEFEGPTRPGPFLDVDDLQDIYVYGPEYDDDGTILRGLNSRLKDTIYKLRSEEQEEENEGDSEDNGEDDEDEVQDQSENDENLRSVQPESRLEDDGAFDQSLGTASSHPVLQEERIEQQTEPKETELEEEPELKKKLKQADEATIARLVQSFTGSAPTGATSYEAGFGIDDFCFDSSDDELPVEKSPRGSALGFKRKEDLSPPTCGFGSW